MKLHNSPKSLSMCLLVLAVIVSISLLAPTKAQAATSGDFTYFVSGGKATITDYTGSATDLTIPSTLGGYPVTTIGGSAFYNCDALTSVTIPDSVTIIGEEAFRECSSLTSVTIGDGVTTIGKRAFVDCFILSSVTIGNSVTTIDDYAFFCCGFLVSVVIPDSVTTIGNDVFGGCGSLVGIWVSADNPNYSSDEQGVLFNKDKTTLIEAPEGISGSYIIPDSVTTINDEAFYCCDNLTSVTIPDGITSIGKNTFFDCYLITSVTIPDSVTSISDYAFCGCGSLTDVYYTGTQSQWNAISMGSYNDYYLTGATIHYQHIHDYTSLPATTVDPTCTENGYTEYTCFCGDTYREILPGGHSYVTHEAKAPTCTEPGWEAYQTCTNCDYTTYVELPMGGHNFTDGICTNCGIKGGACGDNLTWTLDDTGTLTISGTGAMYDWSSSDNIPWYSCCSLINRIVIGNNVTSVGRNAFNSCKALTSVTIGDSVTSIGKSAFNACTSLIDVYVTDPNAWCKISFASEAANPMYNGEHLHILDANGNEVMELVLENTVTVIPDRAFKGSALTSVTFPDSVTSIGNNAFAHCSSLTSVTIGDSVTSIGNNAFTHCSSLTSVTIGDSVTSIGQSAFNACTSLIDVYVTDPNAWCKISFASEGANPMYNGEHLHILDANGNEVMELVLDNTVTVIPDRAFKGSVLTSVTIPDSVESIGNRAFYNCTSLASVTIPDSVEGIGQYAFCHCNYLIELTIPDSVTAIGDHAFYDCSSLTNVVIPDSVTSLGDCAFVDCTSLISVTIGNGLDVIMHNEFTRCENLTSVTISASVTRIDSYAFRDCTALANVYYAGNKEQWDAISIHSTNNCLTEATIYYNHPAHDYAENSTVCGLCGFVRAELGITSVVLRPSVSGIYFKGVFALGEGVTAQRYGIAVSVANALPVADDSDPTSLYTIGYNSALIKNILDSTNGKTVIYARAYILLEDGTYIYGNVVETCLYQVVLAVESQWDNLSDAQKAAIKEMYNTFASRMKYWEIPEIKEYLPA